LQRGRIPARPAEDRFHVTSEHPISIAKPFVIFTIPTASGFPLDDPQQLKNVINDRPREALASGKRDRGRPPDAERADPGLFDLFP